MHCICDISNSFDKVWHKGLTIRLKAYGVDGTICVQDYKWFIQVFKNKIRDANNDSVTRGRIIGAQNED